MWRNSCTVATPEAYSSKCQISSFDRILKHSIHIPPSQCVPLFLNCTSISSVTECYVFWNCLAPKKEAFRFLERRTNYHPLRPVVAERSNLLPLIFLAELQKWSFKTAQTNWATVFVAQLNSVDLIMTNISGIYFISQPLKGLSNLKKDILLLTCLKAYE